MVKKHFLCILVAVVMGSTLYAQEAYDRISLSGYKVILIPSENFKIEMSDAGIPYDREVKDGVLSIRVSDQTGRVPKDVILLYVNNLTSLRLHNSELVMSQVMQVDSLQVITASSHGHLRVNAVFLSVNVAAGSSFGAEGTVENLSCAAGAGSSFDGSKLEAKRGWVDIMGYSSAVVNIQEMLNQKVENGNLKNVYK